MKSYQWRVLLAASFVFSMIAAYQNCAPAKLSGSSGANLPSSTISDTGEVIEVGAKVNLASLLQKPLETSGQVLSPMPGSVPAFDYALRSPIFENIVVRESNYTSLFWVHAETSAIVALGDFFYKGSFTSEDIGTYFVFGQRGEEITRLAHFELIPKISGSQSVSAPGAVNIYQTLVGTGADQEQILIEIDAPAVDLASLQIFLKESGATIPGRRAYLITKYLSQALNVEISMMDISGQTLVRNLTLPAKVAPSTTTTTTTMPPTTTTLPAVTTTTMPVVTTTTLPPTTTTTLPPTTTTTLPPTTTTTTTTTLPPQPALPFVNSVANPSFESLSSWENWGNAIAQKTTVMDQNYALQVSASGGVGQDITANLVKGATYRLSAYTKIVLANESAVVGIKFSDSAGATILEKAFPMTTTSFTLQTIQFTVPLNTAKAVAYVWKNASTSFVYVDRLTVFPADTQTLNCGYPSWVSGQNYAAGAIVKYTDGKFYVAEFANKGFDPTISTFYWDPWLCPVQ